MKILTVFKKIPIIDQVKMEQHKRQSCPGGTGVVTGSPPNLVVPEILNKVALPPSNSSSMIKAHFSSFQNFGPLTGLTFASWMAFAIPVMLLNLVLAWLWLQKLQVLFLRDGVSSNSQ